MELEFVQTKGASPLQLRGSLFPPRLRQSAQISR